MERSGPGVVRAPPACSVHRPLPHQPRSGRQPSRGVVGGGDGGPPRVRGRGVRSHRRRASVLRDRRDPPTDRQRRGCRRVLRSRTRARPRAATGTGPPSTCAGKGEGRTQRAAAGGRRRARDAGARGRRRRGERSSASGRTRTTSAASSPRCPACPSWASTSSTRRRRTRSTASIGTPSASRSTSRRPGASNAPRRASRPDREGVARGVRPARRRPCSVFPDRGGALSEMRRVLEEGGRAAIAVCGSIERSAAFAALADSLDRHAGVRVGATVRWLFSLSDPEDLRASLACVAGVRRLRRHPHGNGAGNDGAPVREGPAAISAPVARGWIPGRAPGSCEACRARGAGARAGHLDRGGRLSAHDGGEHGGGTAVSASRDVSRAVVRDRRGRHPEHPRPRRRLRSAYPAGHPPWSWCGGAHR
jgi:hypothetical protein